MKLLEKIRGFLREEEPEAPPAPAAPEKLKKTCRADFLSPVMLFAERPAIIMTANITADSAARNRPF